MELSLLLNFASKLSLIEEEVSNVLLNVLPLMQLWTNDDEKLFLIRSFFAAGRVASTRAVLIPLTLGLLVIVVIIEEEGE